MDNEMLNYAFGLIAMLMLILQSYWLSKSIPPQYVDKLLDMAQQAADKTASPIDNQAISFARWFRATFGSTQELKELSDEGLAREERSNKDEALKP